MPLSHYTSLCDAIVTLMNPLVELVIHDIHANSIVYIKGSLSQRKIGDPSLLDKESLNNLDSVVYPKINFDGKLVKSISVVLESKWLFCINCDVSVFSKMQNLSQAILTQGSTQPKALFTHDWQDKLHLSIHTYLQNHHLSFDHLNHSHKKSLVTHLFSLDAFREKNAAEYVAKVLKLGRATVFKYLKELRKS